MRICWEWRVYHFIEEIYLLDSYVDYPNNTEMYASEEREFRAKLSEIAFSKYPKSAFGEWILRQEHPTHENASKRIITAVVGRMESNKEAIKGIDTSRPLLPQLDLLTDEQLVKAIRSFDPFNTETGKVPLNSTLTTGLVLHL